MAREARASRTPETLDWELVYKRNPGRADQARQEPARDPRRAAGADRGRLRARRRGGHRAAQVVGPLPRQAEDRDVHAPDQAARAGASPRRSCGRSARSRTASAAARASSRRGRTSSSTGSSSARCRRCSPRSTPPGSRPPAAAATPSATSPAARSPASPHDELFDAHAGASRRRPSSSTATPTTRTCRASTRSRSPPAPTAATRPRSTASRSSASCATASRGLRRPRRRRSLVGAAHRARPRRLRRPKEAAAEVLRALLDAWKEDLRYRVSRVKARMKFMVDDYGPEGMRAERRAPARHAAARLHARRRRGPLADHLGVHAQQHGRVSYDRRSRPPRPRHRRPDDRASPSWPRRSAATSAITRQQNFVVTGRARASASTATVARARRDRLPARRQRVRGVVDRLHRRAALQLLGHRDEAAPRRADRAARGALRRRTSPACACTSTAARTPARSTGSATSASRARPCATTRASAGRPTTSSCAAASAPTRRSRGRSSGACRPRSSTSAVAGLVGGWLDARGGGRELRARSATGLTRRRARGPRRPRARTSTREGGCMSVSS